MHECVQSRQKHTLFLPNCWPSRQSTRSQNRQRAALMIEKMPRTAATAVFLSARCTSKTDLLTLVIKEKKEIHVYNS
jgi:hypothetical protein